MSRPLPPHIEQELEEFAGRVAGYTAGALSPDDFKPCRLQLGIYGIRGLKDRQMVRIKVPSGRLTAEQLEGASVLTDEFATGRAHVTTRQDLQIYEVPITKTPELLRRLAQIGLTTREACGNSVRNVTACPFAGLFDDELFDVVPYANAVTAHFLRNPASQALPRKFKMSFSACRDDCAMAPIHDLGGTAARRMEGGRAAHGFRLYVGGGLGAVPRPADVLEPFTPTAQLLPTCEAVIRVFHRDGDRANKQRARLKFLLERIGIEAFRQRVAEMREQLLAEHPERFAYLPEPTPVDPTRAAPPAFPDRPFGPYRRWLATNVRPQRHAGYAAVTIRLLLGDLTTIQMREVAELSRRVGRSQVITTQWQDLCLPWVAIEQLPALFEGLTRIGLAQSEAQRVQDITACPGVDTCQIGVTASRGLARALTQTLEQPAYLADDLQGIRIKISGCPNSCGQHHIADIGLHGAARTVHGRLVPHYQLMLGGGPAVGGTPPSGQAEGGRWQLAQAVVKVPAAHVPQAVERVLAWYRSQRAPDESFRVFARRMGATPFQQLLQDLTDVKPPAEEPEAYRDWDRADAFTMAGMGQGECAG